MESRSLDLQDIQGLHVLPGRSQREAHYLIGEYRLEGAANTPLTPGERLNLEHLDAPGVKEWVVYCSHYGTMAFAAFSLRPMPRLEVGWV